MANTKLITTKFTSLLTPRRKKYPIRVIVFLFLLFFMSSASSEIDYTYRASLGISTQLFDTDVTISSQDDSINKNIDLEDDLGFNTSLNAGWLRGIYRMANRHRISLTYTPVRRTASAVSTKDINIEDNIIKAGASIQTTANTNIFDIVYLYSVYKRPNTEVSISGGLYWFSYNFEIIANGEIVRDGSEEEPLRTDYQTNLKLNAPLPLFGLSGTYEIIPSWEIHGIARYFYISINDITGQIITAGVGTDYYFTRHWGIGISLSTFDLDVEKNGIVFNSAVSWKYSGAQLYVVFTY